MTGTCRLLPLLVALAVAAVGCSDPAPVAFTLSGPSDVVACTNVTITVDAEGELVETAWEFEGHPLLNIVSEGPTGVTFRAPSEATERAIRVRLRAAGRGRPALEQEVVVRVGSNADLDAVVDGVAFDCGLFPLGVASGEPDDSSVVLWTFAQPEGDEDVPVSWQLARDRSFDDVVASGSATATAATGHTVEVIPDGLEPGERYYYRFTDSEGRHSALGRTKTTAAPGTVVQSARVAVTSCSSIYSGYFNAYRRMAERDDLDLVMHLGDYVYDFADEDEYVRVPGAVPEPSTRDEWRDLHMRYLSDPDLRLARAAHPWFALWDNHDVAGDDPSVGIGAFREFLPTRPVDAAEELTVWRTMRMGDLVELLFLDAELFQVSESEAMQTGGTAQIISGSQHAQFETTMRASTTRWRLIGSQKLMATVFGPEGFFPGGLIDPGSWMGYAADQERVYDVLDSVGNNVVVSGDLHFTFAPNLRRGSCALDDDSPSCRVAVELLPAGISRGGIDETLCGGACDPLLTRIVEGVVEELYALNPQVSFFEGIQHGYGVLEFTAEGVDAQVWYSPIREVALDETIGTELYVADGERQWELRFPLPEVEPE